MTAVDHDPAPTGLAAILDPTWLQSALDDIGSDERITGVEQIGSTRTLAQKIRFAVTLAGPGGERIRNYCVKAHFDDGMESLLTEAHVYRDLLPTVDMRAPRAYYTGIDEGTGRSLVILDDLVADGAHLVHDAAPYPVEQCRSTLAQLARLHAATWDDDRWAVDWLAPRLPAMLSMYPAETLQELLDDGRGEDVADELLDGARLQRALEATAEFTPTCVIHGDTHSGNSYLDAQGRACWLDFQITHRDHWCVDVAYHLGTVLDIEDRRTHETDLLRGYLDELRSLGVEAPTWDDAWRDYTRGFAWAFFLWTITRISSRDVVLVHMPRIGAAIADHDTFGQLGATRTR